MSEEASPLHDPSSAIEAQIAPPRSFPRVNLRALTADTSRTLTMVTLIGILLIAGFLRLNHVNWDQNAHLHPDERFLTQISTDTHAPSSVANYFDTDTSAANPYNIKHADSTTQTTFVYGTLPLFLNKVVASHLHVLSLGYFGNYDDYDHYNRSGRALSGLFDLGTIIFIFLIGRQIASRTVGLLAAFLYALSAFPIQNSHFFVVDPFVTFFVTLTLFFAVRSAQHGRYRDFMLAGVGAGLAATCKITAISLLPVVVLSIGVFCWKGIFPFLAPLWAGDKKEYAESRDGVALDRSVFKLVFGSLAALLAGFIAFRIAMPYAFNTPSFGDLLAFRSGHIGPLPLIYPDILNQHWLKDQEGQQKLLAGAAFPPNVQWIGRSPWLWPAQQMVAWGMGPALGVTAWLGLIFTAIYAWVKRKGVWLVPLSWVLGYMGFMGAQFSLYMRYFLPLYPVLTIMAAFLMYKAWQWASSPTALDALGRVGARLAPLRPALPVIVRAGIITIVVFTTLMGLAFYNIYRHPVSRAAASVWIYQNVPAGSVIGHEHWDDEVPTSQPNVAQVQYGTLTFNNFDPDTPQKVQQLLSNLDQVDYIALSSRRLSGTIPRVPAQWPVTARYYETLASGELGFDKVAEFTSYPSIFGHELNDTGAEESYSVYDHPQVTIYKKTARYSSANAVQVLHADAFVPSVNALPSDLGQNGILYRPNVLATQQAGGTWSNIFHPGNVVNRFPLIFWLLAIELAAFALVPLAIVGFRGLPDRGFLLTKPLGVLVLAYIVYEPASYGAFHFERPVIAGALACMVAVGLATAYLWRADVRAFVRERWRFLLFCEAVFLIAFLFSYWIRLQNPDLYHPYNGGEKPMDFAYLNGVIRTTDLTQGPIDPWNAGGYLNYYWFGQFIAATITKLTGIVPEVAYNLLVPMFFSMAAAATFSLSYNLAESTRRLMRRRPGLLPISARGPIIAGVAAIFLVLIAGNLRAVGILEDNLNKISPWHTNAPLLGGLVATVGGFKALIFGDASFHRFAYSYDWWAPSRALSIVPGEKDTVTPITEFPFWTFLFADLHAHLYAIPFSMTAAGVGFGVVMNFSRLNPIGAAREHVRAREISSWAMVFVLALIVGALRWINSWDYPPFLLLSAAALIIGERAKEGRFTLRCLSIAVLKAAVMGVLSYVLFANIAKNYSQSYSSVSRSDQTTALSDYLSHFGIMLFLISGFLLFNLNRAITRTNWIRTIFFGGARRKQPVQTFPVMAALVVAGGLIIWAGTFQRWGVIALAAVGLIAVILVAAREMRAPTPTAPILLFVYAMLALGLGLCGGVEMFTLDGDIGRMNTVFKFYLHVWMMWGVVSAFGMWYLFGVMRPQEAFLKRAGAMNETLVKVPRYAFAGVATLLLVLALVYPYFGTRARIHDRFNPAQGTGNDGLAYLDKGGPYAVDYEATGVHGVHNMALTRDGINWMREHIQGSPTVMEANGPSYRSLGNRVAIDTGLPAVSGWQFHQEQQRVKFAVGVDLRHTDITTFYSTTDVSAARLILRKYDVQWVIFGDEEQFNYPAAGQKKFENGLDGSLELAYKNDSMQIWHVIPQDQLAAASAPAQSPSQ
jgi:YYY domain-containing protein